MTPRELAEQSIVSTNSRPKLVDVVTSVCLACGATSQKQFRYVVKCCRNRGGRYHCRACSNREITSRPEVVAKIKATHELPDIKAEKCAKLKARWANPEYRAKVVTAARLCRGGNSREARRARQLRRLESSEYRADLSQWGRATHKTPNFTPEVRAKLSAATKRNWAIPERAAAMRLALRRAWEAASAGNESSLNRKAAAILDSHGVAYEREFAYGPYHFDFKVSNALIEINGDYWHTLPANQKRDRCKASFVANRQDRKSVV